MERELTIVSGPLTGRLGETLRAALAGRAVRLAGAGESLEDRRVLFAFSLPENGVNLDLCGLLSHLRDCPAGSRGAWSSTGPGTCTPRRRAGTSC